ncbi:hypothetical protein Emag_007051 [Eimeria magna]
MTVSPMSSEALQVDMGEASRVLGRSIQRRETSSVSQSSSFPVDGEASSRKLGLISYNRRLRSRGGLGFKSALAAVASAAAVAVLIFLCAAAYLQAGPLHLTRRRLSEREILESPGGSAACEETSGDGSDGDPESSLQEEELGPSSAKKAKVEKEGSGEDAEAGSRSQTLDRGREEFANAHAAAAISLETHSSFAARFSAEEVAAAQALLALWDGRASAPQQQAPPGPFFEHQMQLLPAPLQQAAAPPLEALVSASSILAVPAVSVPTAGLTVSPVPSSSAGLELQLSEFAPVQLEAPQGSRGGALEEVFEEESPKVPFGSRAKIILANQRLETIDPLADWEPPSSSEAGGRGFVEHAFSRLPRVHCTGPSACSSGFSANRAIKKKSVRRVKAPWLRKLSTLLAQDQLSSRDLREVGMIAERLVSHLNFNEGTEPEAYPSYAVETLGLRFLLLDLTVSALHLLGVPCTGEWWEGMVSRIPDEYTYPFTKWDAPLPTFNFSLMIRLTAAIRVLKGGHRPDPKVVVHLKRCLFCSRDSPLRFLRPAWDCWRENDRLFYQQFEGTPGQSDPVQPGPSHQSSS